MKSLLPWTTLSSQLLHQTPWLKLIDDQCELSTGQKINYTYVNRINGVSVISITTDKKLILVQQYRHPLKKIIWQFPAEGSELNESWRDTAERCLLEEISSTSPKLTDLGLFHADPGTIMQDFHWFLAEDVRPIKNSAKTTHIDQTEEFNISAFSMTEVRNMILTGDICDNWTLAGLALLQLHQIIPQDQ